MTRPHSLHPDDEAVTAYALGELPDAERAALDAAATTDPALRAALDEATATAGLLASALRSQSGSDAGPVLDSSQRAAILARAAEGAPVLSFSARLRRWGLFAATAAAVLTGAFFLTRSTLRSSETSVATGSVTDEFGSDEDGCINHRDAGGKTYEFRALPPATAQPAVDAYEKLKRESAAHAAEAQAASRALLISQETIRNGRRLVDELQREREQMTGLLRVSQGRLAGGVPAVPQPSPGFSIGDTLHVRTDVVRRDVGADFRGLGGESPAPGTVVNLDEVTNGLTSSQANRETDGTESYRSYVENAFLTAKAAPLSTFSVDVDSASYANMRRMLNEGHLPPADAIRLEEVVNYFPYAYAGPTGDDPFAVHLEVAGCPWNAKHRLVRVGLKGRDVARAQRPASNLVFLLDVSGSMDAPNKLPLVKASLRMLLDGLNERDTVAIVVYAGASGLALPPTSCEQKNTILEAIDKLVPSGSTNGAAGIQLAYDTAVASFIPGGINRVVLCTDGDFNVGVTSHDELLRLIEKEAKSKVFLTALGFGMGNYKDDTLELLADRGNGNYGYVDSTREAQKVLVEGASGTLMTIAKDVKIQVEFNPATVASYRLVGYDNRLLEAKDFADDTKDAGEIGAGHTVTAFYEVVPVGVDEAPPPLPAAEPLRYGPTPPPAPPTTPGVVSHLPAPDAIARELLTVKLRWKAPEGDVSTKKEFPLTDAGTAFEKASEDYRFASSVAAFALLLKRSPYAGTANLGTVLELAGSATGFDPSGWRAEFVELVRKAAALMPAK